MPYGSLIIHIPCLNRIIHVTISPSAYRLSRQCVSKHTNIARVFAYLIAIFHLAIPTLLRESSVCSYIIVVSMVSCYSPFHRDELNRLLYPVKFPQVVRGIVTNLYCHLFYIHESSYARSGEPNYDASVTTNAHALFIRLYSLNSPIPARS